MCESLGEVVAAARRVVGAFNPTHLGATELRSAFEAFAELERLAAAGKLALTPALQRSDDWGESGHRSVEEWMARSSGVSVGEAKKVMETAEKVAGLSATGEALKRGDLSLAQAAAIAEAASVKPEAEEGLLEAASKESVRSLRDKSRRVVLESRGSLEERYARQRRLRSFRHWIDDEGMVAGKFRLTPDAGAALINTIRSEADRHYRRAYAEGRREASEAYAADALVGLITGQGLVGSKRGGGPEMVVVVSHEALRRGFLAPDSEEICEVPGFGAVPVSRARDLMSDCFLKGVVFDGRRVTHVRHFGRHRPAEVDTALKAQSVLRAGGLRCSVEGCDRTVGIEWDHEVPFAEGGPTSVGNLNPLCRFHHGEKSAGRVVKRGRTWVSAGSDRSPP